MIVKVEMTFIVYNLGMLILVDDDASSPDIHILDGLQV